VKNQEKEIKYLVYLGWDKKLFNMKKLLGIVVLGLLLSGNDTLVLNEFC
jgi:hypothetical protein